MKISSHSISKDLSKELLMISAINSFSPFHFPFDYFSSEEKMEPPFKDFSTLNELALFLTSGDYQISHLVEWKQEIREFIQNNENDPDELDKFLMTVTAWGLENDPQAMTAFIVDILSLDLLKKMVQSKESSSEIPLRIL